MQINNNPETGVAPTVEDPQVTVQANVTEQILDISEVEGLVTYSYLLSKGFTIAKLKANRSIKEKSVKDKMKSLKKFGQLIPATFVTGIDAVKQGLEIVDFFTDFDCDPNKAIVVIDGQHRLVAHYRLLNEKAKEGEVKYNKEFFLMPTLNPEAAISCQLCEVNTITTPWDGTDFGHAAITMIDSNEELPALEYVAELTGEGCSLPAASCYATFSDKINKPCLIKAIDGKIADILKDSENIEYGKKIRSAVKSVFSASFINGRTLPNWIVSKWSNRKADKDSFIESMTKFFESLSRPDADAIEKQKGTRGGETKETLVNRALDAAYNKFVASGKE